MFTSKADDIYDVIEPFLFYSKLIGLTSFTIQRRERSFVSLKTFFNVMCITLSTIMNFSMGVVLALYTYRIFETSAYNSPNSFEKFAYFVMLAFFLATTLLSWWLFFAERSFCKALNLLSEVDEGLNELKVPIDLKKHKKFIYIITMSLKVGSLAITAATYFAELSLGLFNPSLLIFIGIWFTTEIYFFINLHFILLIMAIKLRFKRINDFLEEFLMTPDVDITTGTRNITKAASLHSKLVDASEAFNRFCGFPVSKT